ncbi:hypothetical protein [Amycolatopsis cihanbeyliensis]|uniref:Uncharacterized protein n=1 Tax=Amycolatopsis cihanbeyliensis TaxID=1128664 RepID=A0A542DPK8_AMYCI|nr:hypothetical protein [Amycolatopsis cihanbeyliensis]TQJ05043.1 hypothetical protein FB471_4864 [Amycolatopsis cihanbeyliensis]
MGTSGAYSGSGGKDGKVVRDRVADYLDGLSSADGAGSDGQRPPLDPAALQRIINLIRPRLSSGGAGDGPSGGGGGASGDGTGSRGGGGPQRTAAGSARTAGRAAAAAYAYSAGDATTLQRLGLDYNELRSLGDDIEVVRRIVEMACSTSDSSIEDHEQRFVAAEVAEWVMEQGRDGYRLTPEEMVRQTIAVIIAETLLVETGDLVNSHDLADVAESDIRDAAEAIAAQADLSVDGATEDEIGRAVEAGLERIRGIVGGGN